MFGSIIGQSPVTPTTSSILKNFPAFKTLDKTSFSLPLKYLILFLFAKSIKTSSFLKIIPLYGNNEHHDIHHAKRDGNYASTFTLWDFLLNTKLKNN